MPNYGIGQTEIIKKKKLCFLCNFCQNGGQQELVALPRKITNHWGLKSA